MVSIVIPVFNEEENVGILHKKILGVMKRVGERFEVIFVDNASTDTTVEKLKTLRPVKVIILTMPFGQTSGLDAGIHAAKGDIVVTMDGDLQNDPEDIPKLLSKLREGYDVVSGWRVDRHDSFGRRLLSKLANWLTGRITGLYLNDSACALKAYRREVVQAIHLYGEMHVFLPAYLHGLGARVAEVKVKHHARQFGVSKHYFMKAVKDLFDLFTIKFLITMTGRPLMLFGGIGIVSAGVGIAVAAVSVYLKLADIRNFGQTPLPMFAVLLFLAGLMFVMMGFLAELMLRVYFETNKKTPYVIRAEFENGEEPEGDVN